MSVETKIKRLNKCGHVFEFFHRFCIYSWFTHDRSEMSKMLWLYWFDVDSVYIDRLQTSETNRYVFFLIACSFRCFFHPVSFSVALGGSFFTPPCFYGFLSAEVASPRGGKINQIQKLNPTRKIWIWMEPNPT